MFYGTEIFTMFLTAPLNAVREPMEKYGSSWTNKLTIELEKLDFS